MFTQVEVANYIDENILHSEVYDRANDKQKTKAFNQAVNTLSEHIKPDELTLKDVAEQVIFLFKLDSTIQRAELGVTYVMVDGVQITMTDADRTLAPSIMNRHRIISTRKRRVGSYATPLHTTFRYGNGGV